MKQRETVVTGKTIEEAIQMASDNLDVSAEALEIEILENPHRSGFLGLKFIPAKIRAVLPPSLAESSAETLRHWLQIMGVSDFSLLEETHEKGVNLSLEGEGLSFLIGRKGEVLDALQYLLSLSFNHKKDSFFRVTVDCGGYRLERQKGLEEKAKSAAARVRETKNSVTMEPMNAYERRIVHTVIQKEEGVVSSSVGRDPHRCVVIQNGD